MSQTSSTLRWRISPDADPQRLAIGLAQIGLATIVCALILLAVAPRPALGFSLLALLPVALLVAFRRWHRYRQSLAGEDNVWLDEAGLHWLDAAGQQQALPRAGVVGFRVGLEDDTLRSVPALTLILSGGHESHPLELHPPASTDEIRRLLAGQWQIEERTLVESAGYDRAIDVYSECHAEFQEWHWEGTTAALGELFDAIRDVTDVPLPPPGVKPPRHVILARRREQTRLTLQHDRQPRLGHDTIAGPAALLLDLAAEGRSALDRGGSQTATRDLKFDLRLGRGNVWTFHLHVREP